MIFWEETYHQWLTTSYHPQLNQGTPLCSTCMSISLILGMLFIIVISHICTFSVSLSWVIIFFKLRVKVWFRRREHYRVWGGWIVVLSVLNFHGPACPLIARVEFKVIKCSTDVPINLTFFLGSFVAKVVPGAGINLCPLHEVFAFLWLTTFERITEFGKLNMVLKFMSNAVSSIHGHWLFILSPKCIAISHAVRSGHLMKLKNYDHYKTYFTRLKIIRQLGVFGPAHQINPSYLEKNRKYIS